MGSATPGRKADQMTELADTPLTTSMKEAKYWEDCIAELDNTYKSDRAASMLRLTEARKRVGLCSADIDPDRVDRAEKVIHIRGKLSEDCRESGTHGSGERWTTPTALEAAIDQLARGNEGNGLMKSYEGCKRYSGFHQRCNNEYGYGPKHGSIVFAIELTKDVRSAGELSDSQREDALWYLSNLPKIMAARAVAK